MNPDTLWSRPLAAPANPHFHPGLIWVRQCSNCDALDLRRWYSSLDSVSRTTDPASLLWSCPSCANGRWSARRRWFDSIYTER